MRFTMGLRWRTVKGKVEKNPVFHTKTGFFYWDSEYDWKCNSEDCCFYLIGHPSPISRDCFKLIPKPQGPSNAHALCHGYAPAFGGPGETQRQDYSPYSTKSWRSKLRGTRI